MFSSVFPTIERFYFLRPVCTSVSESSTLPAFIVGIFSSDFLLPKSSVDLSSLRARFSALLYRVFIQASTKAKCVDALVSTFILSYSMMPSVRQSIVEILRETVISNLFVVICPFAAK